MKIILIFSACSVFIFCFVSAADIKAQTRKAVGGAAVTGSFRDESGSEFSISALGKGKLRVAFSGVYNYKMRNGKAMANLGEARGEADITGDTVIFMPEDTEEKCRITMKFLAGGRLKVRQQGSDSECGFGANVSADGNYKKISGAKLKSAARQ